jgi:hypothetical protein
MSIAEREKQILRVSQQGFHRKLDEALTPKLKKEVVDRVKTVLESPLKEEVTEFFNKREKKPYRSGYYSRGVNTQYGQISDLALVSQIFRAGSKTKNRALLHKGFRKPKSGARINKDTNDLAVPKLRGSIPVWN